MELKFLGIAPNVRKRQSPGSNRYVSMITLIKNMVLFNTFSKVKFLFCIFQNNSLLFNKNIYVIKL